MALPCQLTESDALGKNNRRPLYISQWPLERTTALKLLIRSQLTTDAIPSGLWHISKKLYSLKYVLRCVTDQHLLEVHGPMPKKMCGFKDHNILDKKGSNNTQCRSQSYLSAGIINSLQSPMSNLSAQEVDRGSEPSRSILVNEQSPIKAKQ